MKKDKHKTVVIFRKFKDEQIIALFPYLKENNGYCVSYMHIGQHSAANYSYIVKYTTLALAFDYEDLKHELSGLGYNLQIKKKINRNKFGI
jgi:hypothetical protein